MKVMVAPSLALILPAVAALAQAPDAPPAPAGFSWPDGQRAAISLTFDDARASQLTDGIPLFEEFGVHATFYLSPANIGERADGWRQAASAGHELGNHSMTHPCSGNFAWSRDRALEEYTLDRMRTEMLDANRAIDRAAGMRPTTFAYPCGQTFVGRGARVSSYVPLVNELFLAGRGWKGESPNDPGFVDLAQVLGYPMDDLEFDELKAVIDDTIARGQWLVLAGHDIGSVGGPQVTRVSMLRALLSDLRRPERRVWVDTVAHVAAYVKTHRVMQETRP